MYIAFEGIEGAGKSTVAAHIATRVERLGHEVLRVREPGGTPAGEEIRRLLLHFDGAVAPWTEALLFAAARSQLAAGPISDTLHRGGWVISDRSVYSSLAYQGGGRGLGIAAVRAVNELGLGGVWPDIVVLLRVDVATGLSRQAQPDRIGSESDALHVAVAAAFDELAREEPARFVVIDASQPLPQVVQAAWAALQKSAGVA